MTRPNKSKPRPAALFRNLATGKIAPLREHVEELLKDRPNTDPTEVKNAIYRRGSWYGHAFEKVGTLQ